MKNKEIILENKEIIMTTGENLSKEEILTKYMERLFYQAYALYKGESPNALTDGDLFSLNQENQNHINHVKAILEQYTSTNSLLGNNFILMKGFGGNLGSGYTNKAYEKKIKKEDTIPLFFQHFSPGKALYFNSLTFALRSKKNNRPINLRFDRLNVGWASQLMNACKTFLNPATPMQQRRAMLTKLIMSVVFIGKDQELLNEEDTLTSIYKSYKSPLFGVAIKKFWDKETMMKLLANTFITTPILNIIKKNKEIKEIVYKLLSDKAENMRDMNMFFDSYEQAENAVDFFNKYGFEVNHLGRENFTKYFEHYFNTYIFFEEHFVNWLKETGYTITKLYNKENVDGYRMKALEGDSFNLDIIQSIYEKDTNAGKLLWKRLIDAFDFSYREDALNSFLTQPDLSNSLELCQDVYQEFLRSIGIAYDDKYITSIQAKILREPKEKKSDCLFKNINWVSLTKTNR